MRNPSVLVVGGGIIGLATARQILVQRPGTRVTVLEKEPEVGRHQTGNNSGVLHAGLYYKPGSAKARLAVSGIRQMSAFCEEQGVAFERCGKVVVAVSEDELPRLDELYTRGQANGLTGLRRLGPEELREIEPHTAGIAAVHVPEEGIVDYGGVSRALVREIEARGGRVATGAGVTRLRPAGAGASAGWTAETPAGAFEGDLLVNCAGLHCDRIARLAGEDPELRIVPFRGEYFTLRADRQYLVKHLIYPVPDPAFPFLGVHFTRMMRGGVECGPNAVLAFKREGYRKHHVSVRDLADALSFPGLWAFLRRYPGMSFQELRRSFSKTLFTRALQRLVPEVRSADLAPGGAGVRAQAMLPNGDLVQDFYFVERANALHLLNAPSPGATASLAIGDEIIRRLGDRLGAAPAAAAA